MTPEQKQRIEQIREWQSHETRLRHHKDIEFINFLLSLVKSREADDGSADWCDDCHGYTHKYDCPSRRYQASTPLVDRVVDAVYRSMARYESGEWWLDTLKAKARVKRLLAEPDAATSMRSACVEKVKAVLATIKQRGPDGPKAPDAYRIEMLEQVIEELESVSIQEQK